MKKLILLTVLFITIRVSFLQARTLSSVIGGNDDYYTSVTFPAGYAVGDYIEFLQVSPIDAGASGNYEISISYTRSSIAAAATHLACITHANPNIWREVGRINNNGYTGPTGYNFTVDCNSQYGNARFRIRAVNTLGTTTVPLTVNIKVRSINQNASWTALSSTGNDLTVNKFLPMTNDWNLYVGNPFTTDGAVIALRATVNGDIGIGTTTPREKLSVNGKIRAQEIKVETANWPDYVFEEKYQPSALTDLETYIKTNKHLPGIPSAKEVEENGVSLGEMNAKLLKKIEELTLYIIEQDQRIEKLEKKHKLKRHD